MADGREVLNVGVPAPERQFNERDVDLDHASGEQAALSEKIHAIFLPERLGLFFQIKRPGQWTGRQSQGSVLRTDDGLNADPGMLFRERALQLLQQAHPRLVLLRGETVGAK